MHNILLDINNIRNINKIQIFCTCVDLFNCFWESSDLIVSDTLADSFYAFKTIYLHAYAYDFFSDLYHF